MTIDELQAELDRVWPWLEKAVKRYGDTHRKEHILARIVAGKVQLWTEKDAAAITSIEVYDAGLTEVHIWLCGGKMRGAKQLETRISKWAKDIGAQRILVAGRKGWCRALPGYRELLVTIVKDL